LLSPPGCCAFSESMAAQEPERNAPVWNLGIEYAHEAPLALAKIQKGASLMDLTVCELASLIQTRAVTPVEAIKACFKTIHRVNPAINALVFLCEARAIARAQMQTDHIMGLPSHSILPPLTGIPFAVKDLEVVVVVRGGLAVV